MNGDEWIIIPNWDRFQHYKDRVPLWIKIYLELEDKDEWCELTAAQRGVLVTIWIMFARSRGQIKVRSITDRIPNKGLTKTIEALNHAGLITISASKPLAQNRSLKRSIKKALAPEPSNTAPAAPSEENHEPPRDPEALTKLRLLAAQITKPIE